MFQITAVSRKNRFFAGETGQSDGWGSVVRPSAGKMDAINMTVKRIKASDLPPGGPLVDDGRIYLFDELTSTERPEYVRLDGIVVILCEEGELTLSIDHRMFVAHKNDIIIGMPEAVVGKAEARPGFKFRGLFMSLDYAFKMLPVSVRSWNFKMFFDQTPIISLSETAVGTFNLYYWLLKQKLADKQNPYRSYIVDALMQAFVFEFRSTFERLARLSPRQMSSAENIFGDFIDLLSSAYPKPRGVAYYADRLNITPKYLSVVCKKVGGKNASKIIDAYVSKDIETLLKSSRKSVKEISNELAFPNTSFFGRYVKKNLGCTPNELRRKLNGVGQ